MPTNFQYKRFLLKVKITLEYILIAFWTRAFGKRWAIGGITWTMNDQQKELPSKASVYMFQQHPEEFFRKMVNSFDLILNAKYLFYFIIINNWKHEAKRKKHMTRFIQM